jgi:hypothetical protein
MGLDIGTNMGLKSPSLVRPSLEKIHEHALQIPVVISSPPVIALHNRTSAIWKAAIHALVQRENQMSDSCMFLLEQEMRLKKVK